MPQSMEVVLCAAFLLTCATSVDTTNSTSAAASLSVTTTPPARSVAMPNNKSSPTGISLSVQKTGTVTETMETFANVNLSSPNPIQWTQANDTTTMFLNLTLCDFYCSSAEDNLTDVSDDMNSSASYTEGISFVTVIFTTTATSNDSEENATTVSPYDGVMDPELCKTCRETPTPTPPPSELTLYYTRMRMRIWRYCPPVLFIIGTIGNFLSAVVMLRKSLRSSLTSFFLVSLALVDTLMLWTGLLRHYVGHVHAIFLRDYSNVGCKLHIFLVYWLGQYAAWILVSMTMERFFAIFSPHKAKQYITRTTCAVTIGVVGGLLAILNGHFFWTFYKGPPHNYCTSYDKFDPFLAGEWTWIDFAFFSFIPFAVLIAANLGIITKIAYSNYVRKHTMKQSSGGVKMTSMTAILITVSFMFLITTAPISIYLIIEQAIIFEATPEKAALNNMWWAIVVNIGYINHSFNFFLYCFSGPRFRRELRAMFARYVRVFPVTTSQTVENSVTAVRPGGGGAENTAHTDV